MRTASPSPTIDFAFQNDRVSFRWKDSAHGGQQKIMTVFADEFLRRFLVHVLPKGLVRIRHFGLFANRKAWQYARTLPCSAWCRRLCNSSRDHRPAALSRLHLSHARSRTDD
jgi:hypothetical protein